MHFKSHPVGLANSRAIHLSAKDAIGVALMAAQRFEKTKFTINDFYKRHKFTRQQINNLKKPPSSVESWSTHIAVCWVCGLRPFNCDTEDGEALLMSLSVPYDKDIDLRAAELAFRKELGERMGIPVLANSLAMFDVLMRKGISRSATAPAHMVAMEFGQYR